MKRLGLALVLAAACSKCEAPPEPAPAPAPPPAAAPEPPPGPLRLPPAFPSTFPIYPGAELLSAASSDRNGRRTLYATWQTSDPLAKVNAFYQKVDAGTHLETVDITIVPDGALTSIRVAVRLR
jgi:hypothetical protein